MFEKRVWLSSPTMHGDELKYMTEAYETNWMSTVGENINQVEKLLAERTGRGKAVALSSGTAALHLALRLAGEKIYGKTISGKGALRGNKVFCSDMTFAATVNPVLYEGGEPVFIDSEYETWNMDPDSLEQAFDRFPEVKIIVIAHLYGTPGKMDQIKAIAKKHGALIVEDAAESFGARYKGEETGKLGDYSCISFNGNKIITGSSGGAFLTDSEADADTVRKWSTQSREPAPWYQHEEMGFNYRMSNVIAGIVRGQLPYLSEHIAQKKKIYESYREGFKDLPVEMNPIAGDGSTSNYWLSCMVIDKEAIDQKVNPMNILKAIEALNAEGRPIWKPMHMQPIFQKNIFVGGKVGEDIFARGLCLPSDNKMTEEEQDIIIEAVRGCFG